MTSEALRLKEHLRRVGDVKAASHREATEAHLALPAGERLARGVQLSDSMLRMYRQAQQGKPAADVDVDVEAATWERVNRHLQRLASRADARDG